MTTTTTPKREITIDQARRLLNCSAQNVLNLIARGDLKAEREPGRWKVDLDCLLDRLAQQRTTAGPSAVTSAAAEPVAQGAA